MRYMNKHGIEIAGYTIQIIGRTYNVTVDGILHVFPSYAACKDYLIKRFV